MFVFGRLRSELPLIGVVVDLHEVAISSLLPIYKIAIIGRKLSWVFELGCSLIGLFGFCFRLWVT